MGLGGLLEACRVHEKVGLEHSSKSTKYELEGSYGDPVHEHFSVLETAKLWRECNEAEEFTRSDRKQQMDVKAKGPFRCTHAVQ